MISFKLLKNGFWNVTAGIFLCLFERLAFCVHLNAVAGWDYVWIAWLSGQVTTKFCRVRPKHQSDSVFLVLALVLVLLFSWRPQWACIRHVQWSGDRKITPQHPLSCDHPVWATEFWDEFPSDENEHLHQPSKRLKKSSPGTSQQPRHRFFRVSMKASAFCKCKKQGLLYRNNRNGDEHPN